MRENGAGVNGSGLTERPIVLKDGFYDILADRWVEHGPVYHLFMPTGFETRDDGAILRELAMRMLHFSSPGERVARALDALVVQDIGDQRIDTLSYRQWSAWKSRMVIDRAVDELYGR